MLRSEDGAVELNLTGSDGNLTDHSDEVGQELSLAQLSLCDLALHLQNDPVFNVNSVNELNLTNLTIASTTLEKSHAGDTFNIEKVVGNRQTKIQKNNCINSKNLIQINCSNNDNLITCTLKAAVVNARSLFPKVVETVELFNNLSLDFVAVSETWESCSCDVQRLIVEEMKGIHQLGYLSQPRTNSRKLRGGGVGIIFSLP